MGGTVEHLPNLNGYNARGVKWQKFTTKLNIIRKFMNDGQRPKSLPPISQGQQGFSQSRSTILRYSNSDEKKNLNCNVSPCNVDLSTKDLDHLCWS